MSDESEIRQLVERYASAADRADGEAVAALFTAGGKLVTRLVPGNDESNTRQGRAEIAAAINWMKRYAATQHVIASCVAELDGDRASVDTRCTAHHVTAEDATDRVLYIRYLDAVVRQDGRWLFERRDLSVQWTETRDVESI